MMPETVQSWERTLREGFAPLIPDHALVSLRHDLVTGSPCLLQGATTQPPPLACVQDWPVEKACVVGRAAWHMLAQEKGPEEPVTVGEVECLFARLCFECDQRLGEPAGCRWLLNAWDEENPVLMKHQLLGVLDSILTERGINLEAVA